jgi:hypothetical protein
MELKQWVNDIGLAITRPRAARDYDLSTARLKPLRQAFSFKTKSAPEKDAKPEPEFNRANALKKQLGRL